MAVGLAGWGKASFLNPEDLPLALQESGIVHVLSAVTASASMTPRDGGMTAPMANIELWRLTETCIHSRIRTPGSGQPQHDLICPRHGLRQTKATCDGYESSAQV